MEDAKNKRKYSIALMFLYKSAECSQKPLTQNYTFCDTNLTFFFLKPLMKDKLIFLTSAPRTV